MWGFFDIFFSENKAVLIVISVAFLISIGCTVSVLYKTHIKHNEYTLCALDLLDLKSVNLQIYFYEDWTGFIFIFN